MNKKRLAIAFLAILLSGGLTFFFLKTEKSEAAIKSSHPRIWLKDSRLSDLRQRACYDDSGQTISGCTPSASWTRLKNWVDDHMDFTPEADSPGYSLDALRVVNFALVYKITQDESYGEAAVDKIFTFIDSTDRFDDSRTTVTYAFTNQGYALRYYVPGVSLTFDWAYDCFSASQRSEINSLLDQIGDRIVDGRGATETEGSLWAYHDASNNYWYGHMWALTSSAYAIYNEGTNSAGTFLNYVKNTMIPEAENETKNQTLNWPGCMGNDMCDLASNKVGHSKGGEWSEGNGYGPVNTEFLFSSLLAIKSSEGVNYLNDFNMQNEYILQTIYTALPSMTDNVVAGQTTGSSINGKCSLPVMLAVAAGENSTQSKYGAYYFTHDRFAGSAGDCYPYTYKYFNFFIWTDTDHAKVNYEDNLDNSYYAEGMRIMSHRSDWTNSATWLQMRFNGHYSGHTHNGQGGNFSLYKNGWLVADNAKYSDNEDTYFNVVYLPDDADTQMWYDQPIIDYRVETNTYIYYAGDASPVFTNATCGSKNWRDCDVETNQRRFFYLKDKYLLVYDRVETDDAHDEKKWQIYFDGQPTLSSNIASYDNGESKVFVKTLWPANPNTSTSDFSCRNCNDWRYHVSYPSDQTYNNFLHTMEVENSGVSSMDTNNLVTSSNGNMLGSFVNNQYLIMFSEDNTEISSTTYNISAGGKVTHFITGLEPNTTYYFSGPTLCNNLETNSSGVLSFTSDGSGQVSISTSSLGCQTTDLIPSPYTPDDSNAPVTETPGVCQEEWSCNDWSACFSGRKTRQCLDYNNCGTTTNKPAESVSCQAQGTAQDNPSQEKYLAVTPTTHGGPHVRIYDKNLNLHSQFFAYAENFRRGVNTTMGDIDGDGQIEVITGTGPGSAPHVRIFDTAGNLENQFYAYPARFRIGLSLAAGDVDGDGIDEIIFAPQERGGPHIRIFKYNTSNGNFDLFDQFFSYPSHFRMGVNVTAGDLNNNGREEIIVAPKNRGGPHVRTYEYSQGSFQLYSQFFAYIHSFRGGVSLAVGDTDNDGHNEIITGAGPGGGPHVRIFNAQGEYKYQFFAASTSFRGGVDITSFDYDQDGAHEIISAAYSEGLPGVKVFDYNNQSFQEEEMFYAFSTLYRRGIRVTGH